MQALSYGLVALGPIIAIGSLVLSIVLIVSVISTASSSRRILHYVEKLYTYSKVRMLDDGKVDPETQGIKYWRIDDEGKIVRRNDAAGNRITKGWICPKCGADNNPGALVCASCAAEKPSA